RVRLAFLTSTPSSLSGGSGNFVEFSILQEALAALGCRVERAAWAAGRPPLGHTVQRLAFNWSAGRRLARLGALAGLLADGDGAVAPRPGGGGARGPLRRAARRRGVPGRDANVLCAP